MVKNSVGYRFSPTGEELINDYLRNKNLALSKIKSNDLIWYFFSLKEYSTVKKTTMKRTTGSGFWKPTGKDRIIKDKRGSKIGFKKTLVYHEGKVANGVRTSWVMHEYHITCLPPNQTTYVLCQVKYKGEDADILRSGNDSVVSHPNTVRAMCTVPEIEVDQSGLYGLYMDDLFKPMNEQEDLLLLDAFDPNTFLSDNNLNLFHQIVCSVKRSRDRFLTPTMRQTAPSTNCNQQDPQVASDLM